MSFASWVEIRIKCNVSENPALAPRCVHGRKDLSTRERGEMSTPTNTCEVRRSADRAIYRHHCCTADGVLVLEVDHDYGGCGRAFRSDGVALGHCSGPLIAEAAAD